MEEQERKKRQMQYEMKSNHTQTSINPMIHQTPSNTVNQSYSRSSSNSSVQYQRSMVPPSQQQVPYQQYKHANQQKQYVGKPQIPPQSGYGQTSHPPRRPPVQQQQVLPFNPSNQPHQSHPLPQKLNSQSQTSIINEDSQQDRQDVQIATQLFHNHDVKQMGRLTAEELQNLLQNDDNTHFCMSSVDSLINLFGAARFGTVNLNEFISLYKRIKVWRKIFVDNDINCSFTLSVSEFHNSLQELGYLVPFDISEKLFDQYSEFIDYSRNGKELKFDKFVETLVWMMRLTKVFRKFDNTQEGIATIHYKDFIEVSLYLGRFLPH